MSVDACPKVRVRGGVDETEKQVEAIVTTRKEKKSQPLQRLFASTSITNQNENHNVSSPPARVPESYVANTPLSSIAGYQDSTYQSAGKTNEKTDSKTRTYIRAGSVPRPRAVLSSPDNDEMIGSRNRLLKERKPISRMQNQGQSTLVQQKRVLRSINIDSPVNTRKVSKEANVSKVTQGERMLTNLAVERQKAIFRKGKSSTVEL